MGWIQVTLEWPLSIYSPWWILRRMSGGRISSWTTILMLRNSPQLVSVSIIKFIPSSFSIITVEDILVWLRGQVQFWSWPTNIAIESVFTVQGLEKQGKLYLMMRQTALFYVVKKDERSLYYHSINQWIVSISVFLVCHLIGSLPWSEKQKDDFTLADG